MTSRLPDAPTEQASKRDGAFSYAGEWHAFFVGNAVGIAAVTPFPPVRKFVFRTIGLGEASRTDALKEARAESWYAFGGMVAGMAWGVCLYALLAFVLAPMLVP